MIRKNKLWLVISSVIILIPMIIGLIIWDSLPSTLTTHWGADGTADGWSGKTFAVVALPMILLAFHWICVLITAKDPKNQDQNKKAFRMVLWIIPFISLFSSGIMYSIAMGKEFDFEYFMLVFLGLMFVVIGNYLPKCKQNYTIGIKLPWTVRNEENWNKTHRFSGKIWVVGGLLMMLMIFLPKESIPYVILPVILVLAFIPMIYSYLFSRKQIKNGVVFVKNPYFTRISKIALVVVIVIVSFVLVVLFMGNVNVICGEASMSIEATYWDDIEIEYDDIESVEYRADFDGGVRTYGFGSPRLLLGTFQNDEFGYYTRYSYTNCDACVVLIVDGKVLVISGKDANETMVIYEELMERI